MVTIKELQNSLEKNKASWSVNERLLNLLEIPRYTTGGSKEGLEKSEKVKAIDFKKHLAVLSNNPFILERRIAHHIIPESLVKKEFLLGSPPKREPGEGAVPLGGGTPTSLDWRNRWGWPWITSVRNQNGCEACWLFSAVALVEAMVRIEHCVWPQISEGDVHKGMGSHCCDCGNPGAALDWMKNNGAADPGCFAWPVTSSGCSACGSTGGEPYDNIPYTPTGDRSGRMVKIPSYTNIGSVNDQKKWLDTVGPIITYFAVWNDFFALGTGVYRKLGTVSVGGQPNFGIVWDGRPFWVGDFNGDGRTEIIFYSPGDAKWWLGSHDGNKFQWSFAGDTVFFGLRMNDGRPFWIGRFSHADRDEVLFYSPGDDKWWLGSHDGNKFQWSFAGSTAGFGHGINDGRPFWVGDFNGDGRTEILFYHPGDGNWWLGSYQAGELSWSLASNTGTPNTYIGGHFMLVVGYDDAQGCWIVKNSWGTGFSQGGYCRIAYGECEIDTYAKTGFNGTNPDPWTKKRLHNGNMIESGNGELHRNFEMLSTAPGGKIRHWWRDNSVAGFPWHQGILFGTDAAACPTLIATTYNRNFESVHLTPSKRLHHWWFDQAGGKWNDGGIFGPNDTAGIPGFIQGSYNAPGNFEVVVRTSDSKLNHWWRDGGEWHDGGRFGTNVLLSGASLIQSHYGAKGNFELVCVLNTGQMQHWWRDNDHGMTWNAGPTFGSGVSSPPCMIEGQFGASDEKKVGNFELCVAIGGKVEHWWRANYSDMLWRKSASFGHDVRAVAALVEGSYGFNLEVIVLRTDNKLQHYSRDGAGWHEGPVIGNA